MPENKQDDKEAKAVQGNKNLAALYPNLDDRLEEYMRGMCHVNPKKGPTECDIAIVEYFGVLSLTDVRAPRRKLWYIYYSRSDEIDNTVDRIHRKYGQKNMYELFRKPIYSGADFRGRVKANFANLKWYVKGNILEAPPQSTYTDEKVIRVITDLYYAERRIYYDYLKGRNDYLSRWKSSFST
ncbi:uncharacterized protein [Drosophila tropicalis]|uniref:uncharacterized protein n=1 Tax=Drosophila tropicalis TaxID=46794 RepID=UPI0035AC1534